MMCISHAPPTAPSATYWLFWLCIPIPRHSLAPCHHPRHMLLYDSRALTAAAISEAVTAACVLIVNLSVMGLEATEWILPIDWTPTMCSWLQRYRGCWSGCVRLMATLGCSSLSHPSSEDDHRMGKSLHKLKPRSVGNLKIA